MRKLYVKDENDNGELLITRYKLCKRSTNIFHPQLGNLYPVLKFAVSFVSLRRTHIFLHLPDNLKRNNESCQVARRMID